ncbi:MAG: DUF1156 domain-containing protein [Deltaproteobacteria bacterium]|nr:DUF1156 domain-containing protein [Deltaproteobacteria bacterium]
MKEKHSLEANFDAAFTAALAQREKQIQQNYRPIIGIHKWFARRPGTVFRSLLLSEFNGDEPLRTAFWRAHDLNGIIADPFMGGGTTIYEANRLGFSVVGTDINPIAFWIVRQSLAPLDLDAFGERARIVIADVENDVGDLYTTICDTCGEAVIVKYFIWVKTQCCPSCHTQNDLFPGYLLAEAVRHPRHVVACRGCGNLNECDRQPTPTDPVACAECGRPVVVPGVARGNKVACRQCGTQFSYPPRQPTGPPIHRLWAIEYHCSRCKPAHEGRFFKRPEAEDLRRFERAKQTLDEIGASLPIPEDEIRDGDETRRLHRWGYSRFREMFNERQLLGLGLLLRRIMRENKGEIRNALLTVFSDFLRYQNMLCRYDTYALKCQDIFSVHGFPVGLVQCENNLLGIPRVGSGSFRHFVEKYLRAKQYCIAPFETRVKGGRKEIVPIAGERIEARFVKTFPRGKQRQASIGAAAAMKVLLPPDSLDGVFTDPPYFDNVQYAELMDFCYVWLRLALRREFPAFRPSSTRTHAELTGNETMGRGLDNFTEGLSQIFCHYSAALKTGAPFVFTYHHNDPEAYLPLVVAILDAGLDCYATLPVPAEMGASLHIARSKSSVLDSVFVCRKGAATTDSTNVEAHLRIDIEHLVAAGLRISEGDVRCLAAGHIARVAVNRLRATWDPDIPLGRRMLKARELLLLVGQETASVRAAIQFVDELQSVGKEGVARAASL